MAAGEISSNLKPQKSYLPKSMVNLFNYRDTDRLKLNAITLRSPRKRKIMENGDKQTDY